MITDNEKFIEIQGILSLSDISPNDCIKINNLIIELSKENKELKKHLEELKNGYKIKLEKLLANGIEPDLEDFYLAEIEGKVNDYDKLLNQQKEFIKFLEDNYNLEHDIWYIKILQKYKEIIGGDEKCTG